MEQVCVTTLAEAHARLQEISIVLIQSLQSFGILFGWAQMLTGIMVITLQHQWEVIKRHKSTHMVSEYLFYTQLIAMSSLVGEVVWGCNPIENHETVLIVMVNINLIFAVMALCLACVDVNLRELVAHTDQVLEKSESRDDPQILKKTFWRLKCVSFLRKLMGIMVLGQLFAVSLGFMFSAALMLHIMVYPMLGKKFLQKETRFGAIFVCAMGAIECVIIVLAEWFLRPYAHLLIVLGVFHQLYLLLQAVRNKSDTGVLTPQRMVFSTIWIIFWMVLSIRSKYLEAQVMNAIVVATHCITVGLFFYIRLFVKPLKAS